MSQVKITKSAGNREPRSYAPLRGLPIPHHRRKDQTGPLVYLCDGQTLAQRWLLRLPGQVGFSGDRPQDTADRPCTGPEAGTAQPDFGPMHFDNGGAVDNLSYRWKHEVIPTLLPIYIQLIHQTDNLHTLGALPEPRLECICTPHELSGHGKTKRLKVMLLRWDSLDEIEIRICPCSKAAGQLLRRGFFPCAPIEPNLAIDLHVLEFVMKLFLHMPPNNTALTKTLESYLDSLGYKLDNRDALR
ncbi:hypothetical protein FB451DRAFT_1387890 [Mycena latifolia]|nr:hypothetical protein FB451DRAFT_1387890 [Mycena latifolia]